MNSILTDFAWSGAIAKGPVPDSNAKGGASASSDTVSVLCGLRLWIRSTSVLGDTPIPTGPNVSDEATESLPPGTGVGVGVGVGTGVGVDDGVAVAEGVGEETGVGVTDGVGVAVADGDAVAVEVAVADGAGVGVDAGVGVGVGDLVGVGVGVGDAVGVGVAVARGWSYSSTLLLAESAMNRFLPPSTATPLGVHNVSALIAAVQCVAMNEGWPNTRSALASPAPVSPLEASSGVLYSSVRLSPASPM